MKNDWVVCEKGKAAFGAGNGVWAICRTRLGAEVMLWKIVHGRFRGSRQWRSWRRTGWYTPPPRSSLEVLERGYN